MAQNADSQPYDQHLVEVEFAIRNAEPAIAVQRVLDALPQTLEAEDYGFLIDSARLFIDFGYGFFALPWLSKIPDDHPDAALASDYKINAYIALGLLDRAEVELNKRLDIDAFSQNLWERLAEVHYYKGDYDGVEEDCAFADAIDTSHYADLYQSLIHTDQLGTRLPEEVVTSADYIWLYHSAEKLREQGRYDDALKEYQQANLHCPRGEHMREKIVRGIILSRIYLKEYDNARHDIESLFTLTNGESTSTYYDAAEAFLAQGETEQALYPLRIEILLRLFDQNEAGKSAFLLSAYGIYEPAKNVWEAIFSWEEHLPEIYTPLLDTARKALCTNSEG